jgi:hypothetical protein
LALLADAPTNEIENQLRDAIAYAWNAQLPTPDPTPRPAFAVDGSDAMRSFENGMFLVVSHALLVGPDMDAAATHVALVRDTLSSDSRERLRGLFTRALEVKLACEEIHNCAGGTLYLDGSLYAELGHLIYPYEAASHAEIPLVAVERYLDLLDAARQSDVRVVALSKTTRGHLLAHALLKPDTPPATEPGFRWHNDADLPNDGEILARWTQGPGYTTPILVGWEAFGNRSAAMAHSPERLTDEFARAGADRDRAGQAMERLRRLPVVWASYVRLDDGDDCLRVEFLADEVLPAAPRITDIGLATASSPSLGREWLAGVVADHTTPRLYNTGLYVADRLVRLGRKTVDEKYVPLLRTTLGVPLRLNRSERRFHDF